MMTFKEIDERIDHYQQEVKWTVDIVNSINRKLKAQKNENRVASLSTEKMKAEFFGFVTTSYIDLLCVYKNLKRSKAEWEKFYNIKIAYLIAYETINTYHKYRGEIYKAVNSKEQEFYKNFFDMLNRELADLKRLIIMMP
jgi:hypothetical protein